jgi:Skp family chaperone for outer membrane proteins
LKCENETLRDELTNQAEQFKRIKPTIEIREVEPDLFWSDVEGAEIPSELCETLAKVIENQSLRIKEKFKHCMKTMASYYQLRQQNLQEKSEKAQKSWAQKEKNLQYEATQLQEKYQKGLMTTADFQQKGQALEKRAANFQTNTQKEMQSLEEENFVFTNRSQDLLMRAIKEINAEGKYKMVVNATALLDAAAALDISDAVLAKVNELYAKEKNAPATEEPATK